MIKRIELVNFMSHGRTVIEPAAGLTVLAGPNNCGKSAVIAALQILCHNENSTYVLKHQEKNCRIVVETDDGHVIEWSRKKNGSPKYLINDNPFDRLKGSIPPELHAALRLPKVESDKSEFDIHFGEQKNPVFLLNDSPRSAAEFFASSSDAIRLVEMQALHKQKVRDGKKDLARLEAERDEIESAQEELAPLTSLQKQVESCEKQFYEINVTDVDIDLLGRTIDRLISCTSDVRQKECQASVLARLPGFPEFSDEDQLERRMMDLCAAGRREERLRQVKLALGELPAPPEICDEAALESLLTGLLSAETEQKQKTRLLSVLGELKVAPDIEDETPLAALIQNFQSRRRGFGKA